MDKNNSDKEAEQFVLNFFRKANTILEKKGGKLKKRKLSHTSKSYKKQKGGMMDDDSPILPIPVTEDTKSALIQLKEEIATEPTLKHDLSINITHSNAGQRASNTSLTEVLKNIHDKNVLELSPGDVQLLSMFIQISSLKSETNLAGNKVFESISNIDSLPNKAIINDEKSEENIQKMSQLLEHVEGPTDLGDKQIKIVKDITENAITNMNELVELYNSNARPEEISKETTSNFMNLLGNLSALFNMLSCYANRISDMASLIKKNPFIYFIINVLQTCIAFVMFLLHKLWSVMISTVIGRIFIAFILYILYKSVSDNPIVIFLTNVFIKLLTFIDDKSNLSVYITECIESTKQYLIEAGSSLLKSAVVREFMTSVLTNVFSSPEVAKNFAPVISKSLMQAMQTIATNSEFTGSISQSLATNTKFTGAISQGITEKLAENPQLIKVITEGVTSKTSELMTPLIDGITQIGTNMGVMEGKMEVIGNEIGVIGQQIIAQGEMGYYKEGTKMLTNVAFNVGIPIITSYLGFGPTSTTTGLLTNSGGKKTKKFQKTNNFYKTNKFQKTKKFHKTKKHGIYKKSYKSK